MAPKNTHAPMTSNDVQLLNKEIVYQGYFRMAKYCIKHKLYAGGWRETKL